MPAMPAPPTLPALPPNRPDFRRKSTSPAPTSGGSGGTGGDGGGTVELADESGNTWEVDWPFHRPPTDAEVHSLMQQIGTPPSAGSAAPASGNPLEPSHHSAMQTRDEGGRFSLFSLPGVDDAEGRNASPDGFTAPALLDGPKPGELRPLPGAPGFQYGVETGSAVPVDSHLSRAAVPLAGASLDTGALSFDASDLADYNARFQLDKGGIGEPGKKLIELLDAPQESWDKLLQDYSPVGRYALQQAARKVQGDHLADIQAAVEQGDRNKIASDKAAEQIAEPLATVGNASRNFAQGAVAPGLNRFEKHYSDAAGQDATQTPGVLDLLHSIFTDVPGNVREGAAAVRDNGGAQRIGAVVPDLAPGTPAGFAYNTATALGSDPVNFLEPGLAGIDALRAASKAGGAGKVTLSTLLDMAKKARLRPRSAASAVSLAAPTVERAVETQAARNSPYFMDLDPANYLEPGQAVGSLPLLQKGGGANPATFRDVVNATPTGSAVPRSAALMERRLLIPPASSAYPRWGMGAKNVTPPKAVWAESTPPAFSASPPASVRPPLPTRPVPGDYPLPPLPPVKGEAFTRVPKPSFARRAGRFALDAINAPKGLMYSGDLGAAPLRQGLVLSVTRPRQAARAFAQSMKAFAHPETAAAIERRLAERPNAEQHVKYKIGMTRFDADAPHAAHEEAFTSRLVGKLPVVGRLNRASERGYSTFLNVLRADTFDSTLAAWQKAGLPTGDTELHALGDYIANASGRANLGALEKHPAVLEGLNAVFASPRFQASRVKLVQTLFAPGTPAAVRKMAIRDMSAVVGAQVGILALAKASGADVNFDPASADFGKVVVGKTRLDFTGGFGPFARLFYQEMAGRKVTSSGTEKRLDGSAGETRGTVLGKFVESKLAPSPSLVLEAFRGTTYEGKPFEWKEAIVRRSLSLFIQDVRDSINENGPVKGAFLASPGLIGGGVQTFTKGDLLSDTEAAAERGDQFLTEARHKAGRELRDLMQRSKKPVEK